MKTERNVKQRLIASVLTLVMLVSSLIGTTFAWFTDSVTSTGNKIQAGSLKIDLELLDKTTNAWSSLKESNAPLFDYDKWEPGYMDVKVLKVENEGTLALKWMARFVSDELLSDLAKVIDVYVLPWGVSDDATLATYPADRNLEGAGYTKVGTLDEFVNTIESTTYGNLLAGQSAYLGIALKMQETAGNEYQNLTLGEFDIQIVATQMSSEDDSYGNDYDADAEWPEINVDDSAISAPITLNNDGTLASETVMRNDDGTINVILPEGLKFEAGTTTAKLNVNKMVSSGANITLEADEELKSYDVHIDGVATDNTVPVVITINELLPVGLNSGNFRLHHVENGNTVEMYPLSEGATPVHNNFTYDPATGNTTLYLVSFSEVAVVANTENAWNGKVDKTFAGKGTEADPFIIATADELAGMSQLVSNNESYAAACYKLVANVNFGGYKNYWVDGIIDGTQIKENVFYPIGYWAEQEGKNAKDETYYDFGNGFSGTFDGNGHTISGICQRTWDMDGNYDNGYWDAAMGLFGYVNGGTVKNLTIRDFESDGEFTPTGCVAAYARAATFENIALVNCNPRVYNTGNGGIVGILGLNDDENIEENTSTFRNITVDNSNTITALWGTWDGCCGGIAGMYRGRGPVVLENCHVGAKIDAYNDVCGNYQYYWYRYSGMLIAAIKTETTDANGYIIPDTSTIKATDCTVHFGEWNNYYYCELVANSIASYTHDHQFSRLTQVASVDVENKKVTNLKGETTDIPTSGRVNYVVVEGAHATENATCYHFVDGKIHNHDDYNGDGIEDFETVNGESIRVENNRHIYLPFNQIFQGWGWGVKNIPIYDDESLNPFEGVTVLDRATANSVDKFDKANSVIDVITGKTIKVTDLFKYLENCGVKVIPGAVTITITDPNETGVTGTVIYDPNNWENSTIKFSGKGTINVTIQDYYFCNPTTIEVNVVDTKTVYFQNNWIWSNVQAIYSYNDGRTNSDVTISMNVDDNKGNFVVYSCQIPDNADTFIIKGTKNGSTAKDQTPSINLSEFEDGNIISMWYDNGNKVNIEEYVAGYVTIYFQDNWQWGNVNIHYWGGSSSSNWPGLKMTKIGNDGTYDIYSANIPNGTTGIIFSNNGSDDQRTDVDITEANGFALSYYGVVYYMSYHNYRHEVGTFNSSVLVLE